MVLGTTTNSIPPNGIQLIKIIQYLILINDMTICHTMTLCPITNDTLSPNKQINTYKEQIGNTFNNR